MSKFQFGGAFKFAVGDRVYFPRDLEAVGIVTSRVFDPNDYDEPVYSVKLDSGTEEMCNESDIRHSRR